MAAEPDDARLVAALRELSSGDALIRAALEPPAAWYKHMTTLATAAARIEALSAEVAEHRAFMVAIAGNVTVTVTARDQAAGV